MSGRLKPANRYRYGTTSYRNITVRPAEDTVRPAEDTVPPAEDRGASRLLSLRCSLMSSSIRPGTPPRRHETWRIVMPSTQENQVQQSPEQQSPEQRSLQSMAATKARTAGGSEGSHPRASTAEPHALYGGTRTPPATLPPLAPAQAR